MNNLLIIGAGQYGALVKEIAMGLNQYNKIDFLDDNNEKAIGKISDYENFLKKYQYAFVAIGNADIRIDLTDKLINSGYKIATIISNRAYVSPSVKIEYGCIIEPMSVIATEAEIGRCTLVSSGAVVNHNSVVGEGCHIDCNSTVCSNSKVESKTKVDYAEVFRN